MPPFPGKPKFFCEALRGRHPAIDKACFIRGTRPEDFYILSLLSHTRLASARHTTLPVERRPAGPLKIAFPRLKPVERVRCPINCQGCTARIAGEYLPSNCLAKFAVTLDSICAHSGLSLAVFQVQRLYGTSCPIGRSLAYRFGLPLDRSSRW